MKTRNALSLAVLALATSQANAGGFLADTFVRPFNPDLATQLDQANHALGNPVDHAIAGAAEAIIPGAGTALETGWQLQRSGAFNLPNPSIALPNWPQPSMGNVCYTVLGRSGAGAYQPVGTPCWVQSMNGPVAGQVGI